MEHKIPSQEQHKEGADALGHSISHTVFPRPSSSEIGGGIKEILRPS